MDALEKVRKGFEAHGCGKSVWRICSNCPYREEDDPFFDPRITPNHDSELIEKSQKCMNNLLKDAYSLLKVQESSIMTPEKAAVLQGFLLDIPSSESILNSVNCHAISLEDASRIIAICAYACDVMSPSGFIGWLKERFNQDLILKGCVAE